jgi:hypothetical protein
MASKHWRWCGHEFRMFGSECAGPSGQIVCRRGSDSISIPAMPGLRHRHSTSTAFLYPSRDEGFGLPPLESMACPIAD